MHGDVKIYPRSSKVTLLCNKAPQLNPGEFISMLPVFIGSSQAASSLEGDMLLKKVSPET